MTAWALALFAGAINIFFDEQIFLLLSPDYLPLYYPIPALREDVAAQFSLYLAILMTLVVGYFSFQLNRGNITERRAALTVQFIGFLMVSPLVLYIIFQIMLLVETDKSWYFDLTFMGENAGFQILNVWPFEAELTDSRWHYYKVGIVSAVRIVAISIVLCTIIGVIVGVARLSRNKMLSGISTAYVEMFRNMPLVVQLFFWYTAVLLALPRLNEAINIGGWVYISNRIVMLPRIVVDSWLLTIIAVILFIGFRFYLRHLDRDGVDDSEAGLKKRMVLWGGFLGLISIILFFAMSIDTPELVKPREDAWGTWYYEGGTETTIQFLALMIGLTIYTSVQVAEIVRGSIQSLPRGQVEAAVSLGLNPFQRLRLVILPQALRSMIPSMTNQYLNCWKNSSLAMVVGYSDFFAISQTIVNNAGQAVPVFIMILLTYQAGSIIISIIMNLFNRQVTKVKL